MDRRLRFRYRHPLWWMAFCMVAGWVIGGSLGRFVAALPPRPAIVANVAIAVVAVAVTIGMWIRTKREHAELKRRLDEEFRQLVEMYGERKR